MKEGGRGSSVGQITIGLVMITAGIVLVLDQQGVIEIGPLSHWWPLILVWIGLAKAAAAPGERDIAEGVMLVLLGAWLLSCVHHWLGLTYRNSWPLIFVAFGSKTVLQALLPAPPSARAKARAAARAAGGTAADVGGLEDHHA